MRYKIGDTITWGGNDIGSPNFKKVKSHGIIDAYYSLECPFCHNNNIPEEYDIFIEDNIIKKALPMETVEDYLHEQTGYVVLE